jgi:hypothetical protein
MSEQQENLVSIVAWPEDTAKLEHHFKLEKPCPVSIFIEKQPLNVEIHSSSEEPLNVNMDMNVIVKEVFPVCIKLCEPICARSEYTIGIDIFDKPFAGITIRGQTTLFNCQDEYSIQGKYGKTSSLK